MPDVYKEVKAAFAELREYVDRGDTEMKELGHKTAETEAAIAKANGRLDALEALAQRPRSGDETKERGGKLVSFKMGGVEYEYERGTEEHKYFLKALRRGYGLLPENERKLVKLADASDLTEEMKAMTLADDTTGGYAHKG